MSEACWLYALTRSAAFLILSRSSSLRFSLLVGLGSETSRSRLSGLLERFVPKRSLTQLQPRLRPAPYRRRSKESSLSRRRRRPRERRPLPSQQHRFRTGRSPAAWCARSSSPTSSRSWTPADASGSPSLRAGARTRRFAELLLLEAEDPLDEPLRLVAFLGVLLAVCAISFSLRELLSSSAVCAALDRCPAFGRAR